MISDTSQIPEISLRDVDAPEASPSAKFPIAAIGASAGGLAALSDLLETIPENSGIAFVVVTHLDPAHESHMPGLLARHTRICRSFMHNMSMQYWPTTFM